MKRYKEKPDAKKQLYDQIAAEAVDGVWDVKNGLGGKYVGVKKIQTVEYLCEMGYFERVGDGVYRIRSCEEMLGVVKDDG